MNVSFKSIALGALGLAWLGCGTRTSLFAGSRPAPLLDAGSPMGLFDSGSLGAPRATSLAASGDAPRVAGQSWPAGVPKTEVQPVRRSGRKSPGNENAAVT